MASIHYIDDIDKDRDMSVNVSEPFQLVWSDISTNTAEPSTSSQARLQLLDGTYFKYLPEESTGNKIIAVCMKCPEDMQTKVKGYNNCTSNFLSHLKRKHGNQCVEEYKMYMKKIKIDVQTKNDTILKTTASKDKEMASTHFADEIVEDSDISMNVSVSDIKEPSELVWPESSTFTAEASTSSQARLQLLDGTYFKYLPEESKGNNITAMCMKCPRDMQTKVKGFTNCTSNFLSHLKRKHGNQCVEEYKMYIKMKKTNLHKQNDTIGQPLANIKKEIEPIPFDDVIDQDSDISMNASLSDINESLPLVSAEPSTDTAEPLTYSQVRLQLLDGTYFKYLPEESTGNKVIAVCMKCPEEMQTKVKGYNNCTSNFLSHLKRKHGNQCVEEYKAYVKEKKTDAQKKDNTIKTKLSGKKKSNDNKITQEKFDENIMKYFVHSMIPLRAVEDPYFSKIFADLEISEMDLTLMSGYTLERRIENHYELQVTKIKSEIKKVKYVCTKTDIWCNNKINFIGVSAHWISNDLRRVSVALGCQRFKYVHSYDQLYNIIQEIYGDFHLIPDKIIASMLDGDRNFVKAFITFGVQSTNINIVDEAVPNSHPSEVTSESDVEKDELLELKYPANINILPPSRCCTYTLSLCATIDANKVLNEPSTSLSNMHAAIMKKCNILWEATGQLQSAEVMQDVLGNTLSRPEKTRWNSLFDALQQIFSIKDKSLLLHKSLNMENAIKDNEFNYIHEYLTSSRPMADALDIMQNENNTYYGIVLPCLLALRRKLLKIEKKNDFTFCGPLITAYRESIEERFESMFDMTTSEAENAAIAALSYPRFKDKWLTCLESSDRANVLNVFKTCIAEQINENIATVPTEESTQENNFFNFDSDSESSDPLKDRSSSITPTTKAEVLLQHFFAEESQDLQLLNRYPEIKRVFIKYNTPLPSSAAVERIFSSASMTNLLECYKLSDSEFEKRVLLKCNLNYC